MKKSSLYLLALWAVGFVFFLSACGDTTEDPVPLGGDLSITLTGDSITDEDSYDGYVGDTLLFNVAVEAEDGFSVLTISRNNTADTSFSSPAGQSPTTFNTTYRYVLMPEDTAGTVTLRFQAEDSNGKTTSQSFEITAMNTPTKVFRAVLLYAPLGQRNSETFFDAQTGTTYTVNEVNTGAANTSAMIDFGYYYGDDDDASIASPAAYPDSIYNLGTSGNQWNTLNNTLLRPANISAGQYAEARTNPQGITQIWNASTADPNSPSGEAVTRIETGDYLVFELDEERGRKRGLIHVEEVKGTYNQGDYIRIEVIVED
ncbi:hypothetical protein SAMN05421823_103342 [Catalinimonas alkaloidigena]|uniref:DUF5017 domain-containing protein n=1 Tax=Catalinimonas alkaloidigena TaxID=1075417 RepID=A0A1G9E403_9BACT|nr:hypothetical protein [Catalinimonas alkaloidigena]SDK70840.1 hypothetical protein SAMN05421823_103342 [Catalinimonas alkaloidigena]